MTDINRIKKLLRGSTTMPTTILNSGHQHDSECSCCEPKEPPKPDPKTSSCCDDPDCCG